MTTSKAMLLDNLRPRRDAIAADWYQTLIHDSPPNQPDLYQSLVQLTEQILAAVCADVIDRAAAQSIGMWLAVLGCAQAEVLGRTQTLLMQTLPAALPSEARAQVQQRLAVLIGELAIGFCRKTGVPTHGERPFCQGSADQPHGQETSQGIMYRNADAAGDISYGQQAERAHRLSEACLRTVVTNVPIILFSFDCSGVLTLAAGKGLEKLGLTPDQVVGCSVANVCRKVPGFLENRQRAQVGETFTALERANKVVFETTYIPYRDARGAVTGVIGVATDITERARVEAELAGAHQRLAERQESERLHLARELHDSAVQQLLSVKYQLEALQRSLGQIHADEPRGALVDQLLAAAQREVLCVVSQLRGMIGELRPAGLEELGLIAAVEGYISNLQHQHKANLPKIELDLDRRGGSLPQPIALCLFRVIQEAYRNTLKHAKAGVINTRLRVYADAVVLTIRDNGCGFEVPTCLSQFTRANHFGLAGMTERVALVRGRLTLHSQPAVGTELIVRIPLQQMEDIDG